MSFKYLALTMGVAAATFPSITIKEDGKDKQLWIVNPGTWYKPKGGDTMDIPHGGRSYLATSDALGPDNFYAVNLLGGAIEYDVDLSQSGCSCNAALYLIKMPAKDDNGNPFAGEGKDYYCDANMVGGNWCPEFDIMEANTYAWHTTPHKCDAPSAKGKYYNCDRGGSCFQVAHQKLNGKYGPGAQYTINTLKQFHTKISWETSAHFKLEMTQNGQTISMQSDAGCNDYIREIQNDIGSGMAIAVSSWGTKWDIMKWLDQDTGCSGDCTNSPTLTIKNIAYTTGKAPVPPKPKNYDYGNECGSSKDQDCALVSCADHHCKWSWPHDDPAKWNSRDAKCRCDQTKEEVESILI